MYFHYLRKPKNYRELKEDLEKLAEKFVPEQFSRKIKLEDNEPDVKKKLFELKTSLESFEGVFIN